MKHAPTTPLINVTVAFTLGALATYWLLRRSVRHKEPTPRLDAHVRDRVLERLSDLVSNPAAIQVRVESGLVHLSGNVLEKELDRLLSQLVHIPGVHKVHNALTPHDDPRAISSAGANLQPINMTS